MVSPPSQAHYEATYDAIEDVAERWDISGTEAEAFLESVGYFGDPENPDTWREPWGDSDA